METKPALTPERWIQVYADVVKWGMESGVHPTTYLITDETRYDVTICHVSDENRHGMAAVCLNNQPFGFTHEDVEMLRAHAHAFAQACPMMASSFNDIADRIEALLPPQAP